jgi:site-specific DNA recombinase
MTMQRRGVGLKLILPGPRTAAAAAADPALLKALARSRQWFEELASGRASSMTALAQKAGVSRRYVARLLPLAFLAPAIVEAIVAGQAPPALTAEQLTRHLAIPLDWNAQQRIFGIL